jgi:hypothetical protein
MRLSRGLPILSLLLVFSGCATIMHGTTQDIGVTTDPAGAELIVDGEQRYTSPAVIPMKRKDDHRVLITREGYKKELVEIKGKLSWAVAGDFLAGGAIGYGIDAATGAQRRLEPEKVEVRLRPLDAPAGGGKAKTREEKLKELTALREEGKISQEEYLRERDAILAEAGKGKAAPAAGPKP